MNAADKDGGGSSDGKPRPSCRCAQWAGLESQAVKPRRLERYRSEGSGTVTTLGRRCVSGGGEDCHRKHTSFGCAVEVLP